MNSKRTPISKLQRKKLLEELWSLAIFDVSALEIFQSLQPDPDDASVQRLLTNIVTARNRNLISATGQQKLQQSVVAFFGLSVGSHAAVTWTMQARPDFIKIADPDTVDFTNLNRLRYGIKSVGKKKVDLVTNIIKKIHPYTNILTNEQKSIDSALEILNKSPKTHIIVDEIDDLEGKKMLRMYARTHHLPLICATDVGDNVLLDIERYDLSPQPQLFLGRVPDIELIDLTKLSEEERIQMVMRIVGLEHHSTEMLNSLLAIGDTLPTWPQLGATATMAGGILTTTLKKILLGEKVASGRYIIDLDELMVNDTNSSAKAKERDVIIKKIKHKFHIPANVNL